MVRSRPIPQCDCASGLENLVVCGRAGQTSLCDVETAATVWTASAPPLDELGIALDDRDRCARWVTRQLFAVGQNEHLLVYDIRANTAPIVRFHPFAEFPTVAIESVDSVIVVGDTVGNLAVLDLRLPDGIVQRKGLMGTPSGAVVMRRHPTLSLVAVACANRLVHLFELDGEARGAISTAFARTAPTALMLLDDPRPKSTEELEEEAAWAQLAEDDEPLRVP